MLGFFDRDELSRFKRYVSILNAHPCCYLVPGVEASTGSLGQGIGRGIGMALADKMDNKLRHTFVVMGDGEAQEGQVSESAAIAPRLGLNNLVVIMDRNKIQLSTAVSDNDRVISQGAFWRMNGWNVVEIDGHNFVQLRTAFCEAKAQKNAPTLIIADTIMGKGLSFMEQDAMNGLAHWHHGFPSPEQFELAEEEVASRIAALQEETGFCFELFLKSVQKKRNVEVRKPEPETISVLPPQARNRFGSTGEVPKNTINAFGMSLLQLARTDERIVLLTSDLTGSKSLTIGPFKQEFRDRFFDVGIREQSMANIAAGLAQSGKHPVIVVYDAMVNLMAEQIRLIAQDSLPVIIWAAGGGVTSGMGGRSHQSSPEPSLYKYIPGMRFMEPADANETYELLVQALAIDGPVYFRTSRFSMPLLDRGENPQPEKGAYIVTDSPDKPDLIIVTTGVILLNVLTIVDTLTQEGVSVRVINVTRLERELLLGNLKPLLVDGVPVVSVHDAQKMILADRISGIITSHPATKNEVLALGIPGWGAPSGVREPETVMRDSGLDVASIADAIRTILINDKEESTDGQSSPVESSEIEGIQMQAIEAILDRIDDTEVREWPTINALAGELVQIAETHPEDVVAAIVYEIMHRSDDESIRKYRRVLVVGAQGSYRLFQVALAALETELTHATGIRVRDLAGVVVDLAKKIPLGDYYSIENLLRGQLRKEENSRVIRSIRTALDRLRSARSTVSEGYDSLPRQSSPVEGEQGVLPLAGFEAVRRHRALKPFMPYAEHIGYQIVEEGKVFLIVRLPEGRFAYIYLGLDDNLDLILGRRGRLFGMTLGKWQEAVPSAFDYSYEGEAQERNLFWDHLIHITISKLTKEITGPEEDKGRLDDLFARFFGALGIDEAEGRQKKWLTIKHMPHASQQPLFYVIEKIIWGHINKIFPQLLAGIINVQQASIRDIAMWPVLESEEDSSVVSWMAQITDRGPPNSYVLADQRSISDILQQLPALRVTQPHYTQLDSPTIRQFKSD